jgi:hypothetical protein
MRGQHTSERRRENLNATIVHDILLPDELRRENLIAMSIHGTLRPDELRHENLIVMIIHGTLRPDELCRESLIRMIIRGTLRPDELRRESLIAMTIHGIRLLRVVALDFPTAMTHSLRLGEMVALDIPIAMIHDPEARSLPETRLREEIIVVTPGEADQEKGVQEPAVHEISTRDLDVEDHLPETLSIPGLKETTRGRRPKEHRPEALIEASIPGPTGTVGTVARPPIEIAGVSKVQIPLDSNFFDNK